MNARRNGSIALVLFGAVCGAFAADIQAEGAAPPVAQPLPLVSLTNSVAILGILPGVGGRVVEYRLRDRGNVLLADPAMWQDASSVPEATLTAGWTEFNGHIHWLSPQKQFWKQQDVAPKKSWPPDPWLLYGRFEIVDHTENVIELQGPASPVTGIAMRKRFELLPSGGVSIRVTATNVRETPVAWAIWSNTRVSPTARAYVPLKEDSVVWFEPFRTRAPFEETPVRHAILDGYLTLQTHQVPEGFKRQAGKVCVGNPASGLIAAFTEGSLFLKRAEITPAGELPPEHGFIELYTHRGRPESTDLYELEMHGRFTEIGPGGSLGFQEQWELHPYDGPETPAAHVNSLKALLERDASTMAPGG